VEKPHLKLVARCGKDRIVLGVEKAKIAALDEHCFVARYDDALTARNVVYGVAACVFVLDAIGVFQKLPTEVDAIAQAVVALCDVRHDDSFRFFLFLFHSKSIRFVFIEKVCFFMQPP